MELLLYYYIISLADSESISTEACKYHSIMYIFNLIPYLEQYYDTKDLVGTLNLFFSDIDIIELAMFCQKGMHTYHVTHLSFF